MNQLELFKNATAKKIIKGQLVISFKTGQINKGGGFAPKGAACRYGFHHDWSGPFTRDSSDEISKTCAGCGILFNEHHKKGFKNANERKND